MSSHEASRITVAQIQRLAELCREHTHRWQVGRPSLPLFCNMLWRRAIHDYPEKREAWFAVLEAYEPQITRWVRRSSQAYGNLISDDEAHDWAFDILEEYVRDSARGAFKLPKTLTAVLHTVERRVRWRTVDRLRRQGRERDLPATLSGGADPSGALDERARNRAREAIARRAFERAMVLCKNDEERLIVRLRWGQKMMPKDINILLPHLKRTQIFEKIKSLRERLTHDPEMMRLRRLYAEAG